MDFLGFLLLILIPVLLIQWVIWRDRYREITRQVAQLSEKIRSLERRLADSSSPAASVSHRTPSESVAPRRPEPQTVPTPPALTSTPAVETARVASALRLTDPLTFLFQRPDVTSPKLKELARGELFVVVHTEGSFYEVVTHDNKVGYILASASAVPAQLSVPQASPIPKPPQVPPRQPLEEPSDRIRPSMDAPIKPDAAGPAQVIRAQSPVAAASPQLDRSPGDTHTPPPRESIAPPRAGEPRTADQTRKGIDLADWETLIGSQWLNKIGIVVLVIGVSFFLAYSLQYMGPLGKVCTGLGASLALLMTGVFLEKVERYALFAKSLIGGGWALLYFTAYAAHNLKAAKVIEEPLTGLAFLGLVAAGMILHSLKYRSEIVTGLAYFLGFLTVALSPLTAFTLVSSSILAGSLMIIFRIMRWYPLGLYGLAATYLNHLLWLGYRMGGPGNLLATESFWTAQAMLVLYWLLFTATDFLVKPENDREERTNVIINAANTLAFLGLSAWQVGTAFPERLYYLTGFAGVAYVASSYLIRGKPKIALINATVAIVLIALSFPLLPESSRLNRDWLAVAWLIEAAVVLALGFHLRVALLRFESYVLCCAAAAALFFFNLPDRSPLTDLARWLTVTPAIVYYYGLCGLLHKMLGPEAIRKEEQLAGILSGYVATTLSVILLWHQFDQDWLGLVWLGGGLALVEAGIRFHQMHLRVQAYGVSALALIAFFVINLSGQPDPYSGSRWLTVLPGSLAYYYLFARLRRAANKGALPEDERQFSDLWSFAATALLAGLIWKEGRANVVGLFWLGLGLVLSETGIRFQQFALRIQGYVLCALSFAALLMINLLGVFSLPASYRFSNWMIVPVGIAGFYYLFWRLHTVIDQQKIPDSERFIADFWSYGASLLFTVLLAKELASAAVAVAWALLSLALFEAGVGLCRSALAVQAHGLAALILARLFFIDFITGARVFGLSQRLISVPPVVALFYYLRLRTTEVTEKIAVKGAGLSAVYSYAGALLLVALARYELGEVYVVVGWAVLGFILLALGVFRENRDFRLQSYFIGAIAFWRSWSTNFYLTGSSGGIPERIATTVPVIIGFYTSKFLCLAKRETFHKMDDDSLPLMEIDSNPIPFFSLLGTALLTLLLYYEVRGNLLTISWTIEGFVLLVSGFIIRERTFRLSGLTLLLFCILKLFIIDLRDVETLYRIFSFIILGIILILVSFAYTKYKNFIKRYI
jgi:uncharacterized membrane protein